MSSNPKVTERGLKTIFRITGRDDQQGPTAADYVIKNLSGKKIALVHDKSPFGTGLVGEVKKKLDAGKQAVVLEAGINPGEKDYTALVSKLKSANVDIFYWGGLHTEGGLIVRQMRDQGMKTILVSGDALVTDEFWSITGPAGEGTLMTFSPDPRKNPDAAPVVEAFRKKGIEPEGYVLYTYAAVQTWAQAVEKAAGGAKQLPDNKKVIDVLNNTEFNTVLGKFKFDKKGDPTAPGYVFYVWKNGKYDYLQQ